MTRKYPHTFCATGKFRAVMIRSFALASGLLICACEQKENELTDSESSAEPKAETSTSSGAGPQALPELVTFNAHIQPILSEKCYHCHGPDAGTRKPDDSPLRIDRENFAFEPRENGKAVIVPGSPDESLLLDLMKSKDSSEIMPPPESHKTMTPAEIALVEKWIEQGAEYQEHWAFLPPKRADLPKVKLKDWVKNPIDHFVLARMEKDGLSPNLSQNPRRLLRRIYFDVIGLPPKPEELDHFEKAYKSDPRLAVNEVLDQLFAMPAYGEQQGRLWLDAARYADTHGIHIDNYREIWPYRDWVVDAFNRNMPFDQFTIEQLAGDLLDEASLDQKVATGFNRCLPTTGEGGSIAEEVNAMYATDRVSTTFGVWQGLTVGCAECHDHKFDPVSQKEFYQLSAFFRNTTMAALDRNNGRHPPSIFVPRPADRPRLAEIEAETEHWKQVADAKKSKYEAERQKAFHAWLGRLSKDSGPAALSVKDEVLFLPLRLRGSDGLSGVVGGEPASWQGQVRSRPGIFAPSLSLGGSASIELGDLADFDGKSGFSFGGFIYTEGKPNGAILARMDPSDHHRGWDFWLQGGKIGAHIIDQWPDRAVKAVTHKGLSSKQWHHVWVVYDPSKKKSSLTVYIDGKAEALTYSHNHKLRGISTKVPLRLGAREGNDSALQGVVGVQDLRIVSRPMPAKEVTQMLKGILFREVDKAKGNKTLLAALRKQFDLSQPAPPTEEEEKIKALAKETEQLKKRGSYTLIMEEKKDTDPFAYVLERGDYASKGEKVGAGTPAVLPAMGEAMPANREGLARWLVAKENPLTARVTINRYWHYLFGRGLVETTEDFGIMGARPSHPDLLDWLAVEFVDQGWDLQHMLRLMIGSATYQQSASVPSNKLESDPLNILLARSPRFRMHGEQLRDMALSASGLLVDEVGGAPVKPYQPEGIWEAVAMNQSNTRIYKQDKGDKLYRRSIYTLWKRTAPHPAMELLNAPARETFCVRRERTNTPLAAFVLMNDEQLVEACRVLASKALNEVSDNDQRLDFITTRFLSRNLDDEERSIVMKSLNEALQAYENAPDEAAKLISVGDSKADDSVSVPELAAWTLVTTQILNLDEALTK